MSGKSLKSFSRYDASKRSHYSRVLAVAWVKRQRPDIWALIQKEAMEKFPDYSPLPDSLEKADANSDHEMVR